MKSVKNLLVPFIIMIALIIGVIVYFAVEKLRNDEPSETTVTYYDVLYFNSTDIAFLSVYNRETGHSSMVTNQSDANNSTKFVYSGDDAEPGTDYSSYKLSDFVSDLSSFYNCILVSGKGNYADYGLDKPAFTLTIKTVNGNETKVYLGNKTPDGSYCYMFVEGSADIYMVSSDKLSVASKTGISFIDSSVLELEYSDLKTVHFDRKNDGLSLDASVSISDNGTVSLNIIKPYEHPSSSYFKNMIDKVRNLNISEYVETGDSGLGEYGLDEPEYHFVLTGKNGDTTELYFSKLINGSYYGYIKGNSRCFMLNEYQLENLEMKETVLIDPYICYFSPDEFSSITGTYGNSSFKLTLYVPEGKNLTASETSVELDGRNAKISDSSGRSYCSILYESLSCIEIGGVETGADINISQGPVLTLSFVSRNYATTEYSFYTRNDDSFYVFKDGEYMNFYVYSREIFNDGGSDTYSYGYWKAYELLNKAISGSISGVYDMPDEE
ncbi:MAG: DUF4340 domain-containing protein [Clostridiales bacterium]|nr:DUF4340 domain-containing protein [Clostridiales bacterium]